MEFKDILAISGQPGLFRYVAQSRNGFIVESLIDGKRMNASAARERADLIYRQASGVLAEASVRVNDVAAQVGPMAENILAQLSQLQSTISAGKQSLQDAAVILSTLRPSDN